MCMPPYSEQLWTAHNNKRFTIKSIKHEGKGKRWQAQKRN